MARYHVDNRMAGSQQAVSTTYKTAVAVTAATATLCRGRAVSFKIGPDGAPNATDCQIIYTVERQTAAGTSSAATPNPINPADVASRSVAAVNFTGEGTYTLPIWTMPLNQRASAIWNAQDTDAMLQWPATNLNGLAALSLSPTYTGNILWGFDYEDQ